MLWTGIWYNKTTYWTVCWLYYFNSIIFKIHTLQVWKTLGTCTSYSTRPDKKVFVAPHVILAPRCFEWIPTNELKLLLSIFRSNKRFVTYGNFFAFSHWTTVGENGEKDVFTTYNLGVNRNLKWYLFVWQCSMLYPCRRIFTSAAYFLLIVKMFVYGCCSL